jgi:tripeptide aminopeptidase
MKINSQNLVERFIEYVKIDTQSGENSTTYPSTEKQLDLSRLLEKQLRTLGLSDVRLTKHGYVFGTLPSNLQKDFNKEVPPLGFIAHVDTSPDVSGAGVKPQIHKNYQGQKIILPKDSSQVIEPASDPALENCIGHDIITADGTTLLGADNKAGIAEIMTACEFFLENPEVKHGDIKIAFTVDEEIGQGTKYFDVKAFGATYAYTIDGETAGEIENETFCADTATVNIEGINIHPGYAKNKMVNSIKIASDIIAQLPKDSLSPETTEKREGYIHANSIEGGVEKSTVKFLIRDFTIEGLKEKEKLLEDIKDQVLENHRGAKAEVVIDESYRNMRYILDDYPHVVDYVLEAIKRTGLEPIKNLIRGGTDGARLSFMGLPTPNIFTGGHNFHSKREWVSIQDMKKATETIIQLVQVWVEKGENGK